MAVLSLPTMSSSTSISNFTNLKLPILLGIILISGLYVLRTMVQGWTQGKFYDPSALLHTPLPSI